MSSIAVFGGTFNPFHKGHEEMLRALCSIDYIDKVLIIPTKIPPHKSVDYLALDTDRINMCNLVALEYPKAQVCDIELKREGKSYTIDTLTSLSSVYPDSTLYLCVGGDMITSFTSWREYEKILKSAKLIAFKRQTTDNHEFQKAVDALALQGADIFVPEVVITDISSTKIREHIKNKTLSDEFLPSKVFEYINANKVYVKNV